MTLPNLLAIIPARGNLTGIPRKNLRLCAGYPLIVYSNAGGGCPARSVCLTTFVLSQPGCHAAV